MRKKNTLYTVNKWNQPLFMPENKHLFWDGGSDAGNVAAYKPAYTGGDYGMGNGSGNSNTGNISGEEGGSSGVSAGQIMAAVSSAPDDFTSAHRLQYSASANNGFGLVDKTLTGGKKSRVGMTLVNTGATMMNTLGSTGWGALAAGIVGTLGTIINNGWGVGVDEKREDAALQQMASMRNYRSVDSLDDIDLAPAAVSTRDMYTGGVFSKGTAQNMNNEMTQDMMEASSYATRARKNNADNIVRNRINWQLKNYSAYGGPIETRKENDDMKNNIFYSGGPLFGAPVNNVTGVLDYDLALNKQNIDSMKIQGQSANKMQAPLFMNNSYDLGGDIQMHGGDFTTGLTHIDAGQSHEQNPNDGVQLGKDENSVPNLVEEGETVWDDYVFSARILADDETKSKFHLPKKKDITYAEISKKLEKEIAERPNDAISRAGFEAQMQTLEEQQERQKAEMEAARAREAFEALSPEEQTAVMQNAAQQEAMAQQAVQEQAMVEQQAMQQASPEELAMAQQAQMQAAQEQQQLAQMQANVSALGGQLVKAGDVEGNENLYAFAGRMKKKTAKKYGADWFKQMGNALGMTEDEMKGFLENLNPNDPDANMAAFNAVYRTNQENAARKRYIDSQRQSKRNELFGDKGMYRYSADKKHLYKARTNDTDRIGYINKNYTGDVDEKGNITGFLSTEDYNKKRAAYEAEKDAKKKAALLTELEGYKSINERAGDYMYGFNGNRLETPEEMSEEDVLNQYVADYEKGFKWDPKEAQTLQYPVEMEHSPLSYARYVPALGGAIGLFNDLLNPADYSRAEEIKNAGRGLMTPKEVTPHYIGNYLTYRPLDIWYQQNALNAQSRATDRALLNTNSPSRAAGVLANGYNSQLASGNLFRQAQEYNDALKQKVEEFNRGTNIFNAQADMNTQQANQEAWLQAGKLGLPAIIAGNQMMDDIDARKAASITANATNLLQSIGNIGEEAYDEDRLKWLEGTGVLRSDYFNRGKYNAAKGGKLKKKKGLTF